jgi:hypothetical protein
VLECESDEEALSRGLALEVSATLLDIPLPLFCGAFCFVIRPFEAVRALLGDSEFSRPWERNPLSKNSSVRS